MLKAVLFILITSAAVFGQRIALITPLDTSRDHDHSSVLARAIAADGARVIDSSLTDSVFRSRSIVEPFNLTSDEGKNLAAAIGCEFLLIVRSDVLRRASFSRPDYYQAFAVLYLVSARTGRLIYWQVPSFERRTSEEAVQKLDTSVAETAREIVKRSQSNSRDERADNAPILEEVPDAGAPAADGLRPPVPYRRIKPEYTKQAGFYDVKATVDILVDIADTGEVTRTEIVRWAGFGLDESVIDVVRKMNWRPAMRKGKPLAMRVLLRYNFTKIDNDQ